MLARTSADARLKVPGDRPLIIELLQDHAPGFMESFPKREPEQDEQQKKFFGSYRGSLDVFREILESRGWERGSQGSEGGGSQELQQNLLGVTDERSQKVASVQYVWKLFGLAFLIFIFYTFIEFFWV